MHNVPSYTHGYVISNPTSPRDGVVVLLVEHWTCDSQVAGSHQWLCIGVGGHLPSPVVLCLNNASVGCNELLTFN